jgi:hypothetical protein
MNKHIILISYGRGTTAIFVEDILDICTRHFDGKRGSVITLKENFEKVSYNCTETVESLVARINLILNHHE